MVQVATHKLDVLLATVRILSKRSVAYRFQKLACEALRPSSCSYACLTSLDIALAEPHFFQGQERRGIVKPICEFRAWSCRALFFCDLATRVLELVLLLYFMSAFFSCTT